MGAGYTKLLTYLDTGPEAKEDKLKKKYVNIITSGSAPEKRDLTWKVLRLDANNVQMTANNLKEGVQFIHTARVGKQNILVCIQPDDPDGVVFATAYFMILSGLPVTEADCAITNALKEADLKFERKYQKSLEALRDMDSPKDLREQMFRSAGALPLNLLTEDVNKIYELAGLAKPTTGQIKLDEPYVPATPRDRRGSSSAGIQSHRFSFGPKSPTTPAPVTKNANDSPQPQLIKTAPLTPSRESTGPRHSGDLVEASGKHVDHVLLENRTSLTDNNHKLNVSFTGGAGDSGPLTTEAVVSELNSATLTTTTHGATAITVESSKNVSSPKVEPISIAPTPTSPAEMKLTMRSLLSSSRTPDSPPVAQSHVSDASWETLAKIRDSMNKPKSPHQVPPSNETHTADELAHQKRKIKIVRAKVKGNDEHIKAMNEFMEKRKSAKQEEPVRRTIKIVRAY